MPTSEEYAMSPETQSRYESRMRALNTRIIDKKTMIFRRLPNGTIENRIIPGDNLDPKDFPSGWMDSAGKCESDEIYKLACEYPERRAGELRLMLRERDRRVREETEEAARRHREVMLGANPEPVESVDEDAPVRVPEIRTEEPEPEPEEPTEDDPAEDDPRDLLILQGEELGLKLDRRMKPETMRARIAEAGAEPVV